jgi:hypothetical protein
MCKIVNVYEVVTHVFAPSRGPFSGFAPSVGTMSFRLRQPGTNPRACRATDPANQEPGLLNCALGQELFSFSAGGRSFFATCGLSGM